MSLISYFRPDVNRFPNCIEVEYVGQESGFRVYLRSSLLSSDQTFSITEKRNAVDSPSSNHPLSASSAPIGCHWSSRLTLPGGTYTRWVPTRGFTVSSLVLLFQTFPARWQCRRCQECTSRHPDLHFSLPRRAIPRSPGCSYGRWYRSRLPGGRWRTSSPPG